MKSFKTIFFLLIFAFSAFSCVNAQNNSSDNIGGVMGGSFVNNITPPVGTQNIAAPSQTQVQTETPLTTTTSTVGNNTTTVQGFSDGTKVTTVTAVGDDGTITTTTTKTDASGNMLEETQSKKKRRDPKQEK